MYLAGYIERMGTGTGDIIRLCTGQNLKEPEFKQEEEFITTIWRKNGNMAGESKGESKGEIIEMIKGNPKVTVEEIAKELDMSLSGVEKNIRQLKNLGIINRIGPNKGGYWEIIK